MKPRKSIIQQSAGLPSGMTATLSAAFILAVSPAQSATIQKANNASDLNLPASWSGGVVPGANDIAAWDAAVLAANSTILGADLSWKGVSITDPGGAVTIGAGNTLTLGSSGIDMSSSIRDLAISSGLTISGGQLWNVTSGTTLTLGTGTFTRSAGATLTANGGEGTISATNITNTNNIVGPWAAVNTFGLHSYATISGGNVVAYSTPNVATNSPAGGWGGIPSSGLGIDGVSNWDITAAATFPTSGLVRNVNTIRYTGFGAARQNSNSTGIPGVNILTVNGFMNAGTGTFTIGGDPGAAAPLAVNGRLNVTIGATRELVLAPMTADLVFNGIIVNNGANASAVTVFGNNRVILNGNSTYTGPTVISGGTLQVASPVATFGSINTTSGITINGANAKYLHTSSVASTRAITLTRGTLDGSGSLGAVTVGAGTGGVVTHGNGSTTVLTLGSLTFTGAASTTLKIAGGATTSPPALVVTGALATPGTPGAIVVNLATPTTPLVNGTTYNLIGYGSYAGSATDLVAGSGGGLNPRQAVTFADDTVNKFITATITGDTPKWTGLDSGNWALGGTGANGNWKLTTAGTATDYLAGDEVLFDDTAAGTTTIEISDAPVAPSGMTFNNPTKDYTVSSSNFFGIEGSGTLVKSGAGKLTFTTINTFTGATTINGGTVQLGDGVTNGSISSSSSIANNGGLVYRVTGSQTYGNAIAGSGTVTKADSGTLTLAGANAYAGGTTVTGGTVILNGAGTLGSGAISLASGTLLEINKNLPITNTVTGSGAIYNTGSTTVTGDFSGFSGTYTHNSVGVSTAFNVPTATSKDAAYVIASAQGSFQGMLAAGSGDYTLELGSLTGVANSMFRGGNVATGTTTLQIGSLNGTDVFNGMIANGATKVIALTKVGSGTMTLAGANNYTGNTTVNAGTLALADNAQLKFVIGANGVNNSISGSGTVTLDGDFNLDFAGADPTAGNTWMLVNVGTLSETFGSTFSLVGFTEVADVHTRTVGVNTYTFTEANGTLTVGPATGYALWAGINAGNQAPNQDFDNDGTQNGIEYFMNAPTGFTANPSIVGGLVTWPNGGNISSLDYGTQFVVQTSPDLVIWSPVPSGNLTTNTSGPGGSLVFQPPTGEPKIFVRLTVTPN